MPSVQANTDELHPRPRSTSTQSTISSVVVSATCSASLPDTTASQKALDIQHVGTNGALAPTPRPLRLTFKRLLVCSKPPQWTPRVDKQDRLPRQHPATLTTATTTSRPDIVNDHLPTSNGLFSMAQALPTHPLAGPGELLCVSPDSAKFGTRASRPARLESVMSGTPHQIRQGFQSYRCGSTSTMPCAGPSGAFSLYPRLRPRSLNILST